VTVTDFPDWQVPQAHATAIAGTGVPLLRLSTNKKTNTGTTIAGGGTNTLLTAGAMVQPGYEIGVRCSVPAGTGTLPFVAFTLTWTDSVTNIQTARRDVVVAAGNGSGNAITSYFNGPCRGNTLKVVATNLDPAVTVTVDWTINQTSHVYEHDQAGQLAYPATAPNGYTNPGGINGTGVIAWVHPTLAAGASSAYLCALYGGDVFLNIDTFGISSTINVALTDAPGYATGTTAGEFFGDNVTAGTSLPLAMTLPFSPVLLTVSNLGTAGSVAPKVAIVAQNH
jgi:hypothetical protein